ncbi:MAG: CoA-binding protein [Candidatus Poribacteria bacterium]|nr:CoA-binding protein [Candidatus Poribacteria bacterium]
MSADNSDADIKRILAFHTIAVVGLSPNRERPSHGVASYLKEQGYEIIPVNPGQQEILGETSYPDLPSIGRPVEVVDIFRRPEYVPEIVDEAIKVGAKAVWMQLGIVHEEAARKARDAGLLVVQDKCLLVEHRRVKMGG